MFAPRVSRNSSSGHIGEFSPLRSGHGRLVLCTELAERSSFPRMNIDRKFSDVYFYRVLFFVTQEDKAGTFLLEFF